MRFLLDAYEIFDKRPGTTTSHDLAIALQTKYETMSVDAREAHFGTRDKFEAKFPSQPTVLRWAKWTREDLSGFFHGRDPLPQTAAHHFRKPAADDVRLLRGIFEGLFRQLRALAEQTKPLILSASHMVTHTLLPRIELNKLLGTKFLLRVEPFTQVAVRDALLARECDVAIGWAPVKNELEDELPARVADASSVPSAAQVRHTKKDDEAILARRLLGSECELRVLFHPAHKTKDETRLLKKRRDYLLAHKDDDPTGKNFALTPEDLSGTVVMYPNVPHVARFARYLKEELGTQVSQNDHFVTILNAVRVDTGLGLYPGYPWLIREIEHEHRVLSARLELPAEAKFNPTLQLWAYTRKDDKSPITEEVTQKADAMVAALETMLVNEGYPPPLLPPSWEISGPAKPSPEMFEPGKSLHLWYVTGGKGLVMLPRWTEWRIDFRAPTTDDPSDGKLYRVEKPDAPVMDVRVDSKSALNDHLVLRFKRIQPEPSLATHTIAYCPTRIIQSRSRAGLPTFSGVCLLGSLNYSVENRTFCSPLILTDSPLVRDHCINIAHSQLMDFLPGTIVIR